MRKVILLFVILFTVVSCGNVEKKPQKDENLIHDIVVGFDDGKIDTMKSSKFYNATLRFGNLYFAVVDHNGYTEENLMAYRVKYFKIIN